MTGSNLPTLMQKINREACPQTAFWEISPVKSFRLYRECDGARELGSEINPIAGAFPIRRLVLSGSGKPMGIGF